MNIDTNKYYKYRHQMMCKIVEHDGYMDYCQYNGFSFELNSRGYNTTPYGVFK